jgi:hypothetical protein
MKTFKIFLILFALILTFSACKDDDEPNVETQNWEFEAIFNITDPDIYSFTAEGTAVIESDGSTYKILASYTIGQQTFEDITLTGNVVNGEIVIANEVLVIEFEANGVSYTETITFSLPNINTSGTTASGSGPVKIETEPGSTVEEGTLEFEAIKV